MINVDTDLMADDKDPFTSPWVFKGANFGSAPVSEERR